jgi:tetratricopeptide (TPR) repeat protein
LLALAACGGADDGADGVLAQVLEARERCAPALAIQAEALLAGYLDRASDGPGVNGLRFQHAELLWDLQRREEATESYRAVVQADPGAPFAERAARRVVQARFFRLCGDPEPDPERRRLPMARWFAQDLEAYDFYLQYFARTEFAAFVRARRAGVFRDHNHFPEAVQALEEIVWRTPAADLPAWQAAHMLDSLRAMGDRAGAAAWASSFRAIPALMAPVRDNNGIREEVALALGEPVPAAISQPRWDGQTPDVISGILTRPAFCRDPRVLARD